MTNTSMVPAGPRTAAVYVRASTDVQQYSNENQTRAIREYAEKHNFIIVKKFEDNGKSGINLSGRAGLQELLREVQGGEANFQSILVHDISRWGRFQDVDESAYYEFLCKRSRVAVHYCAEPFDDQDSASTAVFKALKRSMAAEYSRELSKKVFAGHTRLSELGYHTGGPAGYGLRRQVVDHEGKPKMILRPGERKALITDRVILIPGPEEEVNIVKEIFDLFANQPISEREIARRLNARGLKTDTGNNWEKWSVHHLLINHKYVGWSVYGRTSFKLSTKRLRKPIESWTHREGAYQPIISRSQFELVQQVIRRKAERVSSERMLESLRDLLKRKGGLSTRIIREDDKTLTVKAYIDRFGTLTAAYELVGYKNQLSRHGSVRPVMKERLEDLCLKTKAALIGLGAKVEPLGAVNYWRINRQFTVHLATSYCGLYRDRDRWQICPPGHKQPHLSIIARMDHDNDHIIDYFVFSHIDRGKRRTSIRRDPRAQVDTFRFDNLDFFLELARRSSAVRHSGCSDSSTEDFDQIVEPIAANLRETRLQRLLIEKAAIMRELLNVFAATWRQLCEDRNFVLLLRAENLFLVPKVLKDLPIRRAHVDNLATARKNYGKDTLMTTVIGHYLQSLMCNAEVDEFLERSYASVKRELTAFVVWIQSTSTLTAS